MPATDTTPGQVTNVAGTVDEFGNIMLVWDPEALAVRYRVRMLLVGVETEYTLAASVTEPMASIGDVEPGQTAQFIVQAVNGSQGVASEPIQVTVLLPATAHPVEPKTALVAPKLETSSVPNGTSNGQAAHSRAG